MKIDKLIVENYHQLDKYEVDIDGRSFFIIGKNEHGKSSLIQAMKGALNSKLIPKSVVKNGQELARIYLEASGDGEKYTVEAKFDAKSGKGKFKIKDQAGQEVKRNVLNTVFHNIGFDIMDFIRKRPQEQIKEVMTLVPQEQQDQYHEHKNKEKELYDQRTIENSKLRDLEGELKSFELSAEDFKQYTKKISVSDISLQIEAANKHNAEVDKAKHLRDTLGQKRQELDTEIEELEQKLAKKKQERQEIHERLHKAHEYFSNTDYIDTSELQQQLNSSEEYNSKVEQVHRFIRTEELVGNKRDQIEVMTKEINDRRKAQRDIIADNMPVPELNFDDDGLYVQEEDGNAVRLNLDEAATSKVIKYGAYLTSAINKNLRTIFIKDASLLDPDNLDVLINYAHENDLQLILEIVGKGKLTHEWIESKVS